MMLRVVTQGSHRGADQTILAQAGGRASPPAVADAWLALPRLDGHQDDECWLADGALSRRHHSGFDICRTPEWAWLDRCVRIASDTDIADLSDDLFTDLIGLLDSAQLGSLHRLWIVIPDIHRGSGDQERYKQFCVGRHRAFTRHGLGRNTYPAATVLGSRGDQLVIHALCGHEEPRRLENPRQTNAYDYPREYGPSSPSFSRATRTDSLTLISGTAAVRGAASQYPGDLRQQIGDIHHNLACLIAQSAQSTAVDVPFAYGRIYLRPGQSLQTLQAAVSQFMPYAKNWPVLEAEICRRELLCEVEAAYP